MYKIDLKPISVNDAWKGQRFKTPKYKQFERDMLFLLPRIELPKPPYEIFYEFGFSTNAADLDNPVKMCQDVICKKYGFNDNLIHKIHIEKVIVPKGKEYLKFDIFHNEEEN